MNSNLKHIYDLLPYTLQNTILTAYSALLDRERYGGEYRKISDEFLEFESLSPEEIRTWQDGRLRRIVHHAYDTVPYYRNLFDNLRLKPTDIKSQNDLHKLPLLTKQDIVNNFEDLISRSVSKKNIRYGHTSGTTGSPLEIAYDSNVIYATYSALERQYRWGGARLERRGDRIAVVRGNVIVPLKQKSPPFWRYNWFHNQLLLSSFHMSRETLSDYFSELRRFQPQVIDGYPSTLYVLAKYLDETNQDFPVDVAFTSSETLYDFQRDLIEKRFKCQLLDYYGLAERVVFSTECRAGKNHHLVDNYGITEIVDKEGEALAYNSEGILVGTSLHNFAMPLLRYATNDCTAITDDLCPCGCSHRIMKSITTKAEDMLRLRDGRLISPSVLTHPFKPLHGINGSQIIQKDYDHIVVKIVPLADIPDEEISKLKKSLLERIGDVNIEIEYVDSLPRTSSGKFKWVVSNLSQAEKGL